MSALALIGRVALAATIAGLLLLGARAAISMLMPATLDASHPSPVILLATLLGGAGFALARRIVGRSRAP